MSEFAQHLITWQHQHGRHDLPWQRTRDPYRIWISEIMLQQTQVTTVIPYYQRFMTRFPGVNDLANAAEDEVLTHWSGLGYYARARNLHRAAQQIMTQHRGRFPAEPETIASLPGIGRSTAAAIAAFAFGARAAILDGNVKRVLARCFGVEGDPTRKGTEQQLWTLAESLLPQTDVAIYTQAIMDLGATLCVRRQPHCAACPVQTQCVALQSGRTAELPSPKQRKALPQREQIVLVLQHGQDFLLEKRPAQGIWGGLWSLPEVAQEAVLTQTVQARFGVTVLRSQVLSGLQHTFTHFRLRLRPLWVATTQPAQPRPGQIWLTANEAIGAALPTPIRTILRQFVSS